MNLTNFDDESERVTAVMTSHLETGENYEGSMVLGYYTTDESGEVWIAFDGHRINVQNGDVAELCKQLKRTATLAAANAAKVKAEQK